MHYISEQYLILVSYALNYFIHIRLKTSVEIYKERCSMPCLCACSLLVIWIETICIPSTMGQKKFWRRIFYLHSIIYVHFARHSFNFYSEVEYSVFSHKYYLNAWISCYFNRPLNVEIGVENWIFVFCLFSAAIEIRS